MNLSEFNDVPSAEKAKAQLHASMLELMMQQTGLSRECCEERMAKAADEKQTKTHTMNTPEINDGGPAFPQWDGHAITSEPTHLLGGMSLRDYFAGQALQGLLVNAENGASGNALCEEAYKFSDAMLRQRNKK